MKNRNESLSELRKKLPYGSFKRIQSRLNEKDIRFSIQYISRCLNPIHPDYNQTIIEEAINVVEEEAIQINKLCHRIERLNNPS